MVRTEEVLTMAYREVDMWEILEVLRRLHRQESKAAIKRATGRTRKTIRRYLTAARALGWDGTAEPTEALAVAIARQGEAGPGNATGGGQRGTAGAPSLADPAVALPGGREPRPAAREGAPVEYHVYRDEVSTLTYIDSPACRDDFDAVRTDLQATDIGSPPASTAWYYLVTAESGSANEGTLGMGTCAERSNFTPCP